MKGNVRLCLAIACLVLLIPAVAACGGSGANANWVRQFGTADSDAASGVAVDGEGNVIVVGDTWGTFPGQNNSGETDAYVRKVSPAGSVVWTRQFGSSDSEQGKAVAVDGAGNIIVVGITDGALPGQGSLGRMDAFIRKLSPAGAELWTRQFGSKNWDEASSVAVDAAGDIIVAGYSEVPDEATVAEELAGGIVLSLAPIGVGDAFVRKFSSAGVELWARQFGLPGGDEALAVAVDGGGNIIVAGAVGFGYNVIDVALPGQAAAGGADAFVRKYSRDGTVLWTDQFGSRFDDWAYDVIVDGAGDIIVAGYTEGTLSGQKASGAGDAFVRKLNAAGAELWMHQFGSADSDQASGVAVDSEGNIFLAGDTWGTLAGQVASGSDDAFVQKLSPAGVELWTNQFGSASWALCSEVAVDGGGNVIVVGATNDALSGQKSAGSWDAFVLKGGNASGPPLTPAGG